MAPFAFLGPAWDDKLEEVYATTSTEDIIDKRSKLSLLTGDNVLR